MSKKVHEFILSRLERQDTDGLRRSLRVVDGLVDFSSNDYLGFARSEELFDLIEAEARSAGKYNGSTGSRLLSGNSKYYEETESYLAEFFDADSALIFNSGYSANVGVLSSIPQKDDTILYDDLAHSSLKDGARLSLARRFSFKHNDLDDLEQKLTRASGKIFIVIESVYSMDGDESPLTAMCDLAEKYDAAIILDEAHTTGIEGNGKGMAIRDNCHKRIFARIYTFGKAMGIHGACVVGHYTLREYLINFSRSLVYTTALPSHSVAAIKVAFQFLPTQTLAQLKLKENVQHYRSKIPQSVSSKSNSAIQTVIVPGNHHVREVSKFLSDNDMDVRPILSPTVSKGSERLRICLHSYNSMEEIDTLCALLNRLKQNAVAI